MKIEKLPSGNYRVRKMINGKSHSITFDHKPTQREILEEVSKMVNSSVTMTNASKKPFRDCALKYIEIKSNVLSASTKKGYTSVLNNMDDEFLRIPLEKISKTVVQQYINTIALQYSPKTVRNVNGFISAVIYMFLPGTRYDITLPKPKKRDIENDYIPTRDDINRIKEISSESYKIIFDLASYGLRRSEIIALEVEDVRKDNIRINKAKVLNSNNEWVLQKYTKTEDSNRTVPIDPDLQLMERVKKQGYVFKGDPSKILYYLRRKQKALGLPNFRLHDFRHFMATELHQAGYPDKNIEYVGGWSSDHTLKRIYEHERVSKDKDIQQMMAKTISGNL